MDEIRSLAVLAVGRVVSASLLGLGLVLLVADLAPSSALAVAGTGSLLLTLHLLARASRIGEADAGDSELWSMLAPERRPAKSDEAWRRLSEALFETHLRFARRTAAVTAIFFAAALLLDLAF
ncbi:hypothetical protein [Propylenella binzhouense]|uniref:Uncharacterized protein n=1 Tax=Propylenella binzhouense TaxID=2555902 RepID=A0A964T410_9HYPH|nr:hypothetical protein [Propylenella binzhouense]MYZ47985.1 hypothetical protein [Propylenella binzhouense]